jgi:hypothetical protein
MVDCQIYNIFRVNTTNVKRFGQCRMVKGQLYIHHLNILIVVLPDALPMPGRTEKCIGDILIIC